MGRAPTVYRYQSQEAYRGIGVVRSQSSGQNIAQSISASADRISAMAYRDAAIKAEEEGQKEALALEGDQITTLDPATGLPIAYTPPATHGTIRARAYQSMIDRRFEDEVKSDLITRGQEVLAKNPTSSQFKTVMADYVQNMHKTQDVGSQTYYQRFIRETGEEYVAKTFAHLRNKEIAAAQARLRRQQAIQRFEEERKADAAIAQGADPEPYIARIEASINDGLASGSMKVSDYKASKKRIDELRAVGANRSLAQAYANADDGSRSLLAMAVNDPMYTPRAAAALGVDATELGKHIVRARMTDSPATIVSGLQAMGKLGDEYEETVTDSFVSDMAMRLGATSNFSNIEAILASAPEGVDIATARAELQAVAVGQRLDVAAITSDDMDVLSNELLSAFPNRDVLGTYIPDREEINAILGMAPDARAQLAQDLSDRRSALSRIEEAGTKAIINDFGARARGLVDSDNPMAEYPALVQAIESDGSIADETKGTLIEKATQAAVTAALSDLRVDSLDDLRAINNAVFGDLPYTGPSTDAYNRVKFARDLRSTIADREVGYRINAMKSNIERSVASVKTNSIRSAIDGRNASSVLPEDLDAYLRDTVLKTAGVVTPTTLLENDTFLKLSQQGVVPKIAVSVLEQALSSTDTNEVRAAVEYANQMMNATGTTPNGDEYAVDFLVSKLSPEAYGMYSAAIIGSKLYGMSAESILASLRTNPDLDKTIKEDLGLAKSATIESVFDGIPMHPTYRKMVTAMLRVRAANGETLTENSRDEVLDYFLEENRKATTFAGKTAFVQADNVVGPKIGDKTAYALPNNGIDPERRVAFEGRVVDKMISDEGLADLLVGGTALDSVVAGFNTIFGLAPLRERSEMLVGTLRGLDVSKVEDRNIARQRIAAGLPALGVTLMYKPLTDTFGDPDKEPTWLVGYKTDMGSFSPLLINGQEQYLTQRAADTWIQSQARSVTEALSFTPPADVQSRKEMRFQAMNAMSVARGSGDIMARIINQIEWLATLDHTRVDTFDMEAANLDGLYRQAKREGLVPEGFDPKEIFAAKKRQYEALQ